MFIDIATVSRSKDGKHKTNNNIRMQNNDGSYYNGCWLMHVIICFSEGPYFIQQAAIRYYCVKYLVFFASLEGSRLIDYLKYGVQVEPRDSLFVLMQSPYKMQSFCRCEKRPLFFLSLHQTMRDKQIPFRPSMPERSSLLF